jgi:hypothetical protein
MYVYGPIVLELNKYIMSTVSFFTNCYENDWERVLIENRLETMIERCNYDFLEKVLIINNVKDRSKVEPYAIAAVNKKIIDAYYFSEDHSEKILSAFNIKRDSFFLDFYDGYWYSMGPLSAVYFCKGDYLLYFTCDCIMEPKGKDSLWIKESVEELQKDHSIFVANPFWNDNIVESRHDKFKEENHFIHVSAFSDQCFLVQNSRLQGDIYNTYHYASEKYPIYAGNLFEKRVYSYMCNKKFTRITRNDVYYIHERLLNHQLEGKKPSFNLFKEIKKIAGTSSRKLRKVFLKQFKGHQNVDYRNAGNGHLDFRIKE